MQKWEYLVAYRDRLASVWTANGEVRTERTMHDFLNAVGNDGWEVCGQFADAGLILKRPSPR